MLYSINIIKSENELGKCPEFKVDQYNWGGDYRPEVTGRLAYVKDFGFLLNLICKESNPVHDYSDFQDPVYKDSAMEAFFDFDPEENKVHYVNFEMNSIGAMLNHFGGLRGNRAPIDEFTKRGVSLDTAILEDEWSLTLRIPNEYLEDLYGKASFECGDVIRFNCYKIREAKDDRTPEHYASFAPIRSEKPDFHRPEFFAEGILC